MERKHRISQLLADRQPLADAARRVRDAICSLCERLMELESVRSTLAAQLPEGASRSRLEAVSFADLIQRANALAATVAAAQKRFARSRIQIGVLGRAGQGKSTLLQRLTGLDANVIPSGDRGHCTGVRSLIIHDDNFAEPRGAVEFYNESDFLNFAVRPYYDHLGKSSPGTLGLKPVTIEEFAKADLNTPVLNELARAGGDDAAKLSHLKASQEALAIVRPLLGQRRIEVKHESIRDYVAQEVRAPEGDGVIKQGKFRAVRNVEIACRFPRGDVTGLGLTDMPWARRYKAGSGRRSDPCASGGS